MPQKKFVTTEMDNGFDQQTLAFLNGFEETSLGEFRKLLANLVCEGIFFTITGIDPSVEVSITDDNRGNKHVDARNRTTKGSGKKKRTKSKKAKLFSSNSFLPTLLADIQCILFIVEFEPVTLSLSLFRLNGRHPHTIAVPMQYSEKSVCLNGSFMTSCKRCDYELAIST